MSNTSNNHFKHRGACACICLWSLHSAQALRISVLNLKATQDYIPKVPLHPPENKLRFFFEPFSLIFRRRKKKYPQERWSLVCGTCRFSTSPPNRFSLLRENNSKFRTSYFSHMRFKQLCPSNEAKGELRAARVPAAVRPFYRESTP